MSGAVDIRHRILVGTSGYVFPDWRGSFYPKGLPQEHWIRYYTSIFNALELNTTFYAIPPRKRMEALAQKLPEGFHLIIKLPRDITHAQPSRSSLRECFSKLADATEPLQSAGVVDGYLAQFPVSFRAEEGNIDYVSAVAEACDGRVFFEFRNAGWLLELERAGSRLERVLRAHGAGWVVPDAPRLPELMPPKPIVTGDAGYIRLHGRNAANWYDEEKDRYDYLYTSAELTWISELAKELFARGAKKVFVFFNNCHRGKAGLNAKAFAQMIGLVKPELRLL